MDANGKAVAAVLSQGEVGNDLPISYVSRILSKSENNYSITKLECLAIIYIIKCLPIDLLSFFFL